MSMQLNRTLKATVLGSLLALVVAGPVSAVDGVIEINQARAKVGGVTPGDTPLFPVTISQPGSYRLTGNLDVTDASARPGGTLAENTTAIQVTADNVTIDLNGFMIKGPTACSGSPFPCAPTGTGIGIDAGSLKSVAVMNGTIRGMGSSGVSLGNESQAEKIRALSNGAAGIVADTVANCTANSNGGAGVNGITVANCTADGNGETGILASTVAHCTANSNVVNGIQAFTVANCTANSNGGIGINTTTATGCTAGSNTGSQLSAKGVNCDNICSGTQCPGVCPTPGP